MFKRLVPVAGILGLLTVALAGSAAAGGGGGFGGPGLFKFNDWSANANFVDAATGNYYTSVFVDRGMLSFKLKHTPGAPVIEEPGTVLNVFEQSPTSLEYGCWVIPDSAFAIASDLSSASLDIHATSAMQCPGFFVGAVTGGRPGLQSSLGFGGGGGGGGGPTVITDLSVNLAWTGSGALWSNQNSGVSKCQSFVSTSQGSFDYEFSAASGAVAGAPANDPLAQIAHSTQSSNANSTVSSACNPFGF